MKNGKTAIKLEIRIKTEIAPTNGTYLTPSCPTFSTSKSRIPNSSGFVSRNSAICCIAPGFSTDKRDRTINANIVPINTTNMPITTCWGIGVSGCAGCTCSLDSTAAASGPRM